MGDGKELIQLHKVQAFRLSFIIVEIKTSRTDFETFANKIAFSAVLQ